MVFEVKILAGLNFKKLLTLVFGTRLTFSLFD